MATCPPLKYGRKYNFSAGPSCLPEEVLETARDDLLNYKGCGFSVMEMSHRSKEFESIAATAEQDLRDLMAIPKNYKVLFLSAGAVGQFSAVPLNLGCIGDDKTADYINSGVQYHTTPYVPPNKLLVCDMSSSILSKNVDISKYALIMGGAQKNAGPAGVTIVIVREDLVVKGKAHKHTPEALNYFAQANEGSMRNTPPTFPWYMCGLTFKWLKEHGGVAAMEKHHDYLSSKLYDYLDGSNFYKGFVVKEYRSKMNIPFTFKFKNEELEATFLKEAGKVGLATLKGYKTMGGFRASMYNAMPTEGVDRLVSFMDEFATKHADLVPK